MLSHPTHGHRFEQVERLRTPERVARLEVERVIDLALSGLAARSVLDVGIGSALFSEAFYRRGLSVVGIDANPRMLQAARGFVPEFGPGSGHRRRAPVPGPAFRPGLHGAGAA